MNHNFFYEENSAEYPRPDTEKFEAQVQDMKSKIELHIKTVKTQKDQDLLSIKRKIEEAELEVIAKEFEAEERRKSMEKLGAGNWA